MIAVDIETGPLPDAELLQHYFPPEKPGEFDPKKVDLGRATKQETIDKKVEQARTLHSAVVLEWETHLENHRSDWLTKTRERAALNPLFGRVLAIGFCDEKPDILESDDESALITEWWKICEYWSRSRDNSIVFHNGFGFDLPFLVRRSWLLDVSVPVWVLPNGRWNREVFADTMDRWTMKYNEFISLDTLATAFGIEGKLKSCSGADFARLWHGTEEERQLATEYLKQDVQVTYRLAQLMGILP